MFDKTLRLLNRFEQSYTYEMVVLPDEDGYLDKECPKEECMAKFKVNADDWENRFSHEVVYCPFCGHTADTDKWWTTEQVEQANNQAIRKIEVELTKALQNDAIRFNHSQSRNSFFNMTFSIKGETNFIDLPAQALEEMEQKIKCEKCGARYAVIGSAFYCPCCGENSAKQTFSNTIEKVNAKVKNIPVIRAAISEKSKDEAERICSSLLESSISDLVVALQRLGECIYPTLSGATPLNRNEFQRLDDGNSRWKSICGKGYTDWLTTEEYLTLKRCFQQRHILQHKDGVVDQDYITKSGDNTYQVGQHLIVRENDVLRYSEIIRKIGSYILNISPSESRPSAE